MRTLVTGGAGFIGHHLVARLLSRGEEVVVLDNRSSSSPMPDHPEATYVEGDVVSPPALDGRFDVIYHLASVASPPRYLADPIGTLRASSEGTRIMLERAESDEAVFLFASTSEIYGDPLVNPQDETYAGNVDVESPRACYDEAKRYGEALVYAFERTNRVPDSRVARIFNTYGPGMDPEDGRVVTNFVMQALRGEPLTIYGDGSQTRSFCYVSDLVDGLVRLVEAGERRPVNLGNPREITINEFADIVASKIQHTGRDYRPLPQSDPLVRRPDITRAAEALNWRPTTDLDNGLDRTIEYLRTFSA
ncbi:MAG: NAD-dependent epimerase/dehydratase family protein [Acidimicrobiia bacterium]|nr:NAD-dependent epimerase/dehydratase family protein [Acidimicrobiia bacterium]